MKIEADRSRLTEDVKRLKIETSNGVEYRIHECHLTGGLVINKYTEEDCSVNIIPRVSNEILIK